ncbi:MAG TPA: hypothetical protein VHU81_15280 [Thermoanaerobaculia bacterium]|jgi:hypothetical protein|nr:hypothetical protein [Thermoanaerobaculia bacterium]
MKEDLWVIGGEQRVSFNQLQEWNRFKAALVVRVRDGQAERVLEYQSPAEHCPETENPSQIFKAATVAGDKAYLCTLTEVLECDFPSFEVRRVFSHPCFNDLHHVLPAPDGRLFVAVTGLDAVAELSPDGELMRLISVVDASPWDRFSRDVDYRRVLTTKPHRSHPNHLFFLGDRLWVTRFEQRDAVPVPGVWLGDGPEPKPHKGNGNGQAHGNGADTPDAYQIEIEGVHDGHVLGDRLLFTAVNGHLIQFDVHTGSRLALDLGQFRMPGTPDDDRPLGWCRGLLPVGDTRAWVGFTRIRYTRLRRNLSWIRHGFRETEHHRQRPTRIALYDLEEPALLQEIDLEEAGLGALFSVHRAPRRAELAEGLSSEAGLVFAQHSHKEPHSDGCTAPRPT